nr:hypothetical protein [Tanacetum cinerariifolium]
MLKQRVKEREQAANLAVQKKQEDQAIQSFTLYWNFSMIDDEEVLQAREKFMKAIQNFLQKFSHYSFGVMPKNSSNAIAPVLTTEEPEYSLSMRDEHLSTISKIKSDEVIKSSFMNLVPILRGSEVTLNNESECDVPVKDESSSIFTTFTNPLFDCNDNFTSSDDKPLSNEDVQMENFKIYSNPLFDDAEIISNKIDLYYFNAKSNLIESLPNRYTLFDSSPKLDYLEDSLVNSCLQALLIKSTLPTSPILVEDSDSLREEIDIFTEPSDVEIFFEPDSCVLTTKVVKGISEQHVLMPNILPTLPTIDHVYPVYDTLLPFSSKNEDKVFKPDPHYFNAESDLIKSLSNRDTLFDSSPKLDYLKEFSGEIMTTSIINEERIKREHEEYISLMEKLLTIDSFHRPLVNFQANTIIETLPTSLIPVEDGESLREEIDIFTSTDDLMPPGIESNDYNSEGDIHFLEESFSSDSISLPENESSNFDHHDDPSFPRPPSEPPDVEFFFDFDPIQEN